MDFITRRDELWEENQRQGGIIIGCGAIYTPLSERAREGESDQERANECVCEYEKIVGLSNNSPKILSIQIRRPK